MTTKSIYIDAHYASQTRVAITHNKIVEFYLQKNADKEILKGNIYIAKITRVEPSLQAAFVEYGKNKYGFLPFSEINPNYFNLPDNDRKDLMDAINKNKDRFKRRDDASSEEGDDDESGDISDDKSIMRLRDLMSRYKIQDVIKKNQNVLVQVEKNEKGNKGASMTTNITLSGRYCIFMPNSLKSDGISKKITDTDERRRLREIVNKIWEENSDEHSQHAIIARTACAGKEYEDMKRDIDYLHHLWNSIREHTLSADSPKFIYEEDTLYKQAIIDHLDKNVDKVVISGQEAFDAIKSMVQALYPHHVSRLKHYKDKLPIFSKFGIEEQLARLYDKTAPLKSGGYLVINQTEALVSVDVNSGKYTKEDDAEGNAFKNNLEAAHEIARQIRLRDLSGLIVVDFIDMNEEKNNRRVECALKDALVLDKSKIKISKISNLGLLEISRQRLNYSILESNTITCSYCNGRGYVRPISILSNSILRAIATEIAEKKFTEMRISVCSDVALYLLNERRDDIVNFEKISNAKISIMIDEDAGLDAFALDTDNDQSNSHEKAEKPLSNVDIDKYISEENIEHGESSKEKWRDSNITEIKDSKKRYASSLDRRKRTGKKGKRKIPGRVSASKDKVSEDKSLLKKIWKSIVD